MLTPAPARAKLEDVVLCDRSRHSEAPGAVRAVETEQNRGCQGPGTGDQGLRPGQGSYRSVGGVSAVLEERLARGVVTAAWRSVLSAAARRRSVVTLVSCTSCVSP